MRDFRRARYVSPGPDDTYLRPRSGGSYAPRRIAVAGNGDGLWMCWIHYRKKRDALVALCSSPQSEGRLILVDASASSYSMPALLNRPEAAPQIACFQKNDDLRLHHYILESGYPRLARSLSTMCTAVYHLDAVATSSRDAVIVYSGIIGSQPGLQIVSRRLTKGVWQEEQLHRHGHASLCRPKVAANDQRAIMLVADCYARGRYRVVARLLAPDGASDWMPVSEDGKHWQMFPSVVCDMSEDFWCTWVKQTPVRRDDVMGMAQEALVARFDRGRWTAMAGPRLGEAAANLNLGLLPIERYFGYSGNRRSPRLLAASNGGVWLLWEAQKGEEERWEYLHDGRLLARKCTGGRWSQTHCMLDRGCCFIFDEKRRHDPHQVLVAAKGRHRVSGADFDVAKIDLNARGMEYSQPPLPMWRGWTEEVLPIAVQFSGTAVGVAVKPARSKEKLRPCWGDLHCHSAFSPDAEGEIDELLHYARDLAGLDFVAIVDNDFFPNKAFLDSEVSYTSDLADSFTRPGAFVAFAGYEYTYHQRNAARAFNHRVIIPIGGDRPKLIRRNEPEGNSEKAFRVNMACRPDLCIPHHADWRPILSRNEWVAEITSGWGVYILDSSTIHDRLNAGFRFGFVGNGDSHRFMPGLSGGLTGVYAAELSRGGIMQALRNRHCFATTGNRTILAFWINDAFMGDILNTRGQLTFSWKVVPHGRVESIEIICNGEVVHRSIREEWHWHLRAEEWKPGWYYLRVKERGEHARYPHNVAPAWGKWAWSSPIWVYRKVSG